MDRPFDPLDEILRSRAVPQTPEGLAQRIINSAPRRNAPAKKPPSVLAWAGGFFQELFIIPRPALAFALMLMIGIVAGLSVDNSYALYNDELSAMIFSADPDTTETWS